MNFFVLLVLLPLTSWASVKTELLPYKKNNFSMEGTIAFDDKSDGPRPGVVIFSDWMGAGKFALRRAKDLAALGYVALVADVYGKGIQAKNEKEAVELSSRFKKDRRLVRERALGALEALARDRRVNPKMLGAVGYCFGGMVALELAREGSPVRGVVSFHGNLDSPMESTGMYSKVLVLHGANDPFVDSGEIKEFVKEMSDIKADWQMIYYSNAVHAFTNPDAGGDPKAGVAYNRLADERSHRAMQLFFEEIFHK